MIGDRHHDIDAARAVGMASIGVGWGYGTPGELDAASAFCDSPASLAATVRNVLGQET
jgi:phosphoglycolate phosphatase